MQNTLKLIKQFFINIDRSDIDENMENLLSEDIIDSMDIMSLVAEIEKYYKKPLKAEFIKAENFESFQTIKNMLEQAMK
ncbi:acyl carrier protein [Campylobacter coli]